MAKSVWHKFLTVYLPILALIVLAALPRLTALNQYIIVDESDRWLWAKDFSLALNRADLAGTRIGHGYPGVVPAWIESGWIFAEAAHRSINAGAWIGEPGLNALFHEWDSNNMIAQQRWPLALVNTLVVLALVGVVWRLWGCKIAMFSGLLLALDPFYISDSRLNRSEGLIAGLMTLSVLYLIFYRRNRSYKYAVFSGVLAGVAWLTKIQALIMIPVAGCIALAIYCFDEEAAWLRRWEAVRYVLFNAIRLGVIWLGAAILTWVVVWPAMWVTPGQVLAEVYDYATRMSGIEGAQVFFMGRNFQDADPGWLFYPVVFLWRITPLALAGLVGLAIAGRQNKQSGNTPAAGYSIPLKEILLPGLYLLVYVAAMSVGSHKQDRYLIPIFPIVDIMAAAGLVYLFNCLNDYFSRRFFNRREMSYALNIVVSVSALAVQLMVVLPHHPYYLSYFNPLVGGGKTAPTMLRIGWGEGMDQVGTYLAAKPNSDQLTVATRFTHNVTGFGGQLISPAQNGRWTKADYIVLYIQQAQRGLEPSPGFIHYFQARPAEKIIRLGDVDYAWIYPSPFEVAANPQVSQIPGAAALLGYRWDDNAAGSLRLIHQNLQLPPANPWQARLAGPTVTDWVACAADPAFAEQAITPDEFVESVCRFDLVVLPPGIYSVEIYAAGAPLPFPEGQFAVNLSSGGNLATVLEADRLQRAIDRAVPPTANRIDRLYDGRLKLAAVALDPSQPSPGDRLVVTLYWQAIKDFSSFATTNETDSWQTDFFKPKDTSAVQPVRLAVKLADSRLLPLGRANAEPQMTNRRWGDVFTTTHRFELSAELVGPLAAQVEVELTNEAGAMINAATSDHQPLTSLVGKFTVAPENWSARPDLKLQSVNQRWQNGITLSGYAVSPEQISPGNTMQVNLYWQTTQAISRGYAVFIHLVDENGQIKAQSDGLPLAGAYPTDWWLPGKVIADSHPLALPPDLSPGRYQLVVGLYEPDTGERLGVSDGGDSVVVGMASVISP